MSHYMWHAVCSSSMSILPTTQEYLEMFSSLCDHCHHSVMFNFPELITFWWGVKLCNIGTVSKYFLLSSWFNSKRPIFNMKSDPLCDSMWLYYYCVLFLILFFFILVLNQNCLFFFSNFIISCFFCFLIFKRRSLRRDFFYYTMLHFLAKIKKTQSHNVYKEVAGEKIKLM